jgi:hypothetical protein
MAASVVLSLRKQARTSDPECGDGEPSVKDVGPMLSDDYWIR